MTAKGCQAVKIFCLLADNKLIFMNIKSVSVMRGTPSFLLQPKKSGKWFYLLTIGFIISITRGFVISKKNCFFFVILFPFEILSHYFCIGRFNWLKMNVQRIIDKIFTEKIIV